MWRGCREGGPGGGGLKILVSRLSLAALASTRLPPHGSASARRQHFLNFFPEPQAQGGVAAVLGWLGWRLWRADVSCRGAAQGFAALLEPRGDLGGGERISKRGRRRLELCGERISVTRWKMHGAGVGRVADLALHDAIQMEHARLARAARSPTPVVVDYIGLIVNVEHERACLREELGKADHRGTRTWPSHRGAVARSAVAPSYSALSRPPREPGVGVSSGTRRTRSSPEALSSSARRARTTPSISGPYPSATANTVTSSAP